MGKLEGKIALITGGNSGIGLATAKEFVNEGAYVFITGRRERELAAAVDAIGKNVIGIQGDMAKARRSRSGLCQDQTRQGQARHRLRQCRHCKIRGARRYHRRAVRCDLWRQCEGVSCSPYSE
jgi:NAD(P)-dependent dehydrogenase (short-subunit alcohol dehydrogenase family)